MLVIVGKHGVIARRLAQGAARNGVPLRFTSSRPSGNDLPLDLARPGGFAYEQLGTDSRVVLLGAISAPDRCREDPKRCRAVNVDGTIAFVDGALARGARVLFASSDTVYGERHQVCDERTTPRPLGDYAHMKSEVEARFQHAERFKALRLSYVFSRDDRFTAQLARCSANGEEADVFAPLDRRVVHIEDVVESVLATFEFWQEVDSPCVNVGGERLYSRADIARTFQELCAPSLHYRLRNPGVDFYRERPRVIDMESRYLAVLLGRRPRNLREAMQLEFGSPTERGQVAHAR